MVIVVSPNATYYRETLSLARGAGMLMGILYVQDHSYKTANAAFCLNRGDTINLSISSK